MLDADAAPDLFDPLAAPFELAGSNGEMVVLVHGFTGTPAHFRPMAAQLHERGYSVCVPRIAGHGTSIDDLSTTGPSDWIGSVRAVVASLIGYDRLHLAGLSMGGLISLIIANEVGAATVTTINSPLIPRNKQLYAAPLARFVMPRIEWPDDGPPDIEPEMIPYWLAYSGFATRSATGLLSMMLRGAWAARTVEVPGLVIQSRTDESVDPRSASILARLLGPDSRQVWLEHSLHNAVLDRARHAVLDALITHVA